MTVKRYPAKGMLSAKDCLFNTDEFTEADIIAVQKQQSQSQRHATGLYLKPLRYLTFFFNAQFYLEVDEDTHRWKLHLSSSVPSSLTEIRILKDRMQFAYGTKFVRCEVYQSPLLDEDNQRWINLRNAEDDQAYSDLEHDELEQKDKISSTGINRTVGWVYGFDGVYGEQATPVYQQTVANRRAETNRSKELSNQWLRALLETAVSLYSPNAQIDIGGFEVAQFNIDANKVLNIRLSRGDVRLQLAFEQEVIVDYLSQLIGVAGISFECKEQNIEKKVSIIDDTELSGQPHTQKIADNKQDSQNNNDKVNQDESTTNEPVKAGESDDR